MFKKLATTTLSRILIITALVLSISLLTACGGQSNTTTTAATSYIARIDGAPGSARVGIVVGPFLHFGSLGREMIVHVEREPKT